MKKLAYFLLSAAIAAACVIPAQAADVTALKGTPEIDGVIDEIYTQSGSLKTDSSLFVWATGDDAKAASDATAQTYFLYDDDYFYFATEVKDGTLVDTGIINNWQADAVEHWINFDGVKASKISCDAFNTSIYGSDYTDFDKCIAATTQGDGSYVVEIAIPIGSFATGDVVPVSIQVNDFFAADAASGVAWGSQKTDNNLTLSADEVTYPEPEVVDEPAADADEPTEAAQTSDMGIAAAVLAMSAAAVVIFKKKH